MSSPNPELSVNLGGSSTTPIGVYDSATNNPVEQVEEVAPSEENVSSKRQKRSAVWNDVTETEVNGKTVVKCNHCNVKLTLSKGAPTTSFKRHIEPCVVRKAKISGKGSGSTQALLNYETIGDD
ncbi:hypothetical protein FRX31_005215 [Thalictrum thalictroides]|uniref:BED-type domain-containing protein n=1 Tax=Thalictrum thalictroides TaxID=46969 RepID=A0A7J6X8H9_THATH|nr:hypothetical protein FRX31_005215 [Thalictrum thalictroides]